MAIKDLASNIKFRYIMEQSTSGGFAQEDIQILDTADVSFNLTFLFFVTNKESDITVSIFDSDDDVTYAIIPDSSLILPYATRVMTVNSLLTTSVCLSIGVTSKSKTYYRVRADTAHNGTRMRCIMLYEPIEKPITLSLNSVV